MAAASWGLTQTYPGAPPQQRPQRRQTNASPAAYQGLRRSAGALTALLANGL